MTKRSTSPSASAISLSGGTPKPFVMVAKLATGALLGKVLGFARELLMARVFGASITADSFRGACTAVMMPLGPIQNEGVPAVMVPMHRSWQEEGCAPVNLAALCAGLLLVAALIMLSVQAAGLLWVRLIVGGMSPEGQELTLSFIRLMAFWMPASVLLNCLSAAEIAVGRSRIIALRPSVLNVSMMTGVLLYVATGDLTAIPLLFALSFNLLGAWSIWQLWREGALDSAGLRLGLIGKVMPEFWRRLRPLMAQPLMEQGQIWIERAVASGFAVGTLASIDYARTLTDSAVLLIAQPIGMAVLYRGSSTNSRNEALRISSGLLAVAVPISIYLAIFAQDIVTLTFARGAFNETAVKLTSGALRGIATGLWAATLGMILLRFLNNAGRNGRVAIIFAFAFAVNAALNLLAWQVADQTSGSLLIGLGEAARGIVLLIGAAIALNAHWPLMHLLGRCIPPAAIAAGFCFLVQQTWTGTIAHLAFGALGCVPAFLLAAFLLMPGDVKAWGRLLSTAVKSA